MGCGDAGLGFRVPWDAGSHHGTGELAQPQQGKGEVDAVAGDGVVFQCLVHGRPDPPLQGGHIHPSFPPQHLGWAPRPQEVVLAMLGHNPRGGCP